MRNGNNGGHPLAIERQDESKRELVSVDEKRCPGCGETKPWHQFGLNNSTRSGLSTRCLLCEREYQREWREKRAWRTEEPVSEISSDGPAPAETVVGTSAADNRRAALEKARSVRSENAARRREEKQVLIAQAKQRGGEVMVRPPAPQAMPIDGIAAMLFQQAIGPAPEEEMSELRLRYELAARVLEGQGEILRMLLQR